MATAQEQYTQTVEQYTETVRQTQAAMLTAFDRWTRAFQQMLGQLPTAAPVNPEQVIDQVFDFAGKILDVQRDFAKQLVASGTAATETFRNGVAQATGNAHRG
jgi:hypothetical protein